MPLNPNIYRNVVVGVNVEQLTLNRGTGFMNYTADNGVLATSRSRIETRWGEMNMPAEIPASRKTEHK
mgnify:CR=1 FL=1